MGTNAKWLRRCGGWALALSLSVSGLIGGGADTRLADAARKGDHAAVRSLLEQRIDVNAPQVDGMTALHWAAHLGELETLKLLLEAGADVAAENRYGVMALSLACVNGDPAVVELLLESGADPNSALRGGETPLMTAARTGKIGAVKALLSHGAVVDAEENHGQTAMMWAAAEGHAEVVELLIEAGADFRSALDSGFTPLFFAVREGIAGVVRVLLEAGADLNETVQPRKGARRGPRPGTSALLLAAENGHYELAAELLEAGADPNASLPGFTVLHMITWIRKPARGDDGDPAPQGSGIMTSLEFVKRLVDHGADVNARVTKHVRGLTHMNLVGATPFLMAARTADLELMRTLVDLGAEPLLANAENSTPLMAAAGLGTLSPGEDPGTESEVLEAVKLALELGGEINAVDSKGETAMHGAAYKNVPSVVEYLASRGAKVEIWNQPNKHGWTPLRIAEGHRFGNYKPSPVTVAAFHRVMAVAGISVETGRPPLPETAGYVEP